MTWGTPQSKSRTGQGPGQTEAGIAVDPAMLNRPVRKSSRFPKRGTALPPSFIPDGHHAQSEPGGAGSPSRNVSAHQQQRAALLQRVLVHAPADQPAPVELVEDEPGQLVLLAEGDQGQALHRVEQEDV